jgi:hypothetical protein
MPAPACGPTPQRDDRPRQHPQAGRLAGAPADGDQTASQAGPGLGTRVAVHDDLPAAHVLADLVSRRAADNERPAPHPRTGVVTGIALNAQFAASHPGACVRPDAPGHRQPPGGHARADVPHAAQIALDPHVIAAARHLEELAHPRALVAMPNRQRGDVAHEPVGREDLGLERHDRLLAQRERDHGISSRRWM